MVIAIENPGFTLNETVAQYDSTLISNEGTLAALAAKIAAEFPRPFSQQEEELLVRNCELPDDVIDATSDQIADGRDPLGDTFCRLRTSVSRRQVGAVYTPHAIISAILDWAQEVTQPEQVVDPGSGSGRFLVEAGRRFPHAHLVAIEQDPLAALISRANLTANGMARRSEVRVENFLTTNLAQISGKTLYIGNPPYVRHHDLNPKWKSWFKSHASAIGIKASALAGLHVYFLLKIAISAKPGDFGALITASEWLDVNYGQVVRDLFLHRLGGKSVHIIDPKAEPFPGTAATGAITTFEVSQIPRSARFNRVDRLTGLGDLSGGNEIPRAELLSEKRWSHFIRSRPEVPSDYVELGELCRVHRGQVTGANRIWIAGKHSEGLPDSVLFPTVTRAKELINAGLVLTDPTNLKRVIDLPQDLSTLDASVIAAVENFLRKAENMGAKDSYTAQNRHPWWSVRLHQPAPILATYMARRAPAFVINQASTRHLNVAHGLYPRETLNLDVLDALVSFLRNDTPMQFGRVYAGGLTKFEPREMERIPVPDLHMLKEMAQ